MTKFTAIPYANAVPLIALLFLLSGLCSPAHASLQLQSSVVVVEQKEGEGVIAIQNQSDAPVLLHSELLNIPEDEADLLIVSPPVTRMEAGDTQLVRFILKGTEELKTERLKRVAFEGIPQKEPNIVQVSVRQNIPVIIRPAGLAVNSKPWLMLKWRVTSAGLTVENAGPYVVRMAPEVKLRPTDISLGLPRSYILPGEIITVTGDQPAGVQGVRIQPASLNGYILESVDMPVEPLPKS